MTRSDDFLWQATLPTLPGASGPGRFPPPSPGNLAAQTPDWRAGQGSYETDADLIARGRGVPPNPAEQNAGPPTTSPPDALKAAMDFDPGIPPPAAGGAMPAPTAARSRSEDPALQSAMDYDPGIPPPAAPRGAESAMGAGVRAVEESLPQTGAMFAGAGAMAADLAKRAGIAPETMQSVEDWLQDKAVKLNKKGDEGAQPTDDWDNVHNFNDFSHFLMHGIGSGVGFGLQSMAASAIGGLLGSAVGPEGTIGGVAAGAISKDVVEGAINKWLAGQVEARADKIAATAAGKALSREELETAAIQQTGRDFGAKAGTAAFATAQGTGMTYEAAREANGGKELSGEQMPRNVIGGALASMFDTAMQRLGLHAAMEGGASALATRGLATRVAGNVAMSAGAGAAGMTGMQTAVNYGSGQPLGKGLLNAAATGAAMGVPFGALAGMHRAANTRDLTAIDTASDPDAAALNASGNSDARFRDLTRKIDEATTAALKPQQLALPAPEIQGPRQRLTGEVLNPNGLPPRGPGENLLPAPDLSQYPRLTGGDTGRTNNGHPWEGVVVDAQGNPIQPPPAAPRAPERLGANPPQGLLEHTETPPSAGPMEGGEHGFNPEAAAEAQRGEMPGREVIATSAPRQELGPFGQWLLEPKGDAQAAAKETEATPTPAEAAKPMPAPDITKGGQEQGRLFESRKKIEPGDIYQGPAGRKVEAMSIDQLPERDKGQKVAGVSKGDAQAAAAIFRVFGKRIQMFKGDTAFVDEHDQHTIHIGDGLKDPILAVVGHEIKHQIDTHFPKLSAAFDKELAKHATKEQLEQFRQETHTPEELASTKEGELHANYGMHEFSADAFGAMFKNRTFFSDFMRNAEVQRGIDNRSVMGKVGALIVRLTRTMMRGLRAPVTGDRFASVEALRQVQSLHDRAVEAMVQYYKTQQGSARDMEAQRLRDVHEVSRLPLYNRPVELHPSIIRRENGKPNGNEAHVADQTNRAENGQRNGQPAGAAAEAGAAQNREGRRAQTPDLHPDEAAIGRANQRKNPEGVGHEGTALEQGPNESRAGNAGQNGPGRDEEHPTVSAIGTHYSNGVRTALSSDYYGHGYAGSERNRVALSTDARAKHRIYFYVNNGKGISPEGGVGGQAHEAKLTNLYDGAKNPLNIEHGGDMNRFETGVLDHGYDGYVAGFGKQKAAVLMGKRTVPVEHVGSGPRAPRQDIAAEEPKPSRLTESRATKTPEQRDREDKAFTSQGVNHLEAARAQLDARGLSWVHNGTNYEKADLPENVTGSARFDGRDYVVTADAGKLHTEVPGDIAATLYHENMHVTDWNGNLYSDHALFDPSVPDSVFDQLRDIYDRAPEDSALREFLGYPLDAQRFPKLHDPENSWKLRAELFAQAATLNTRPAIQRMIRDEAPHAATFLNAALEHAAKFGHIPDEGTPVSTQLDRLQQSFEHVLKTAVDRDAAANAAERSTGGLQGARESRARKFEPDQLDEQRRRVYQRLTKDLTPAEQQELTKKTAQNLVDHFNAWPSTPKEAAAIAYAGRAKRGWLADAAKAIGNVFGMDSPRFAALLAATSPQQEVEPNFGMAVRLWAKWVKAGRPQDGEAIVRLGQQSAREVNAGWLNSTYNSNAILALTHPDPVKAMLSGPKVDSFMRNLLGSVNEVTNDSWMSHFHGVDKDLFGGKSIVDDQGRDRGAKDAGYLAASITTRRAAKILEERTGVPWSPAEVQETVWAWVKTLAELGESAGNRQIGLRDILKSEEFDHDLIAATPDYRSLFHTDANESVLRDAGYGNELDAIGSGRNNGEQQPGAQPGAAEQKAPFDQRTQEQLERRVAQRIERNRAGRKPEPTVPQAAEDHIPGFESRAAKPLEDIKDNPEEGLRNPGWGVLTGTREAVGPHDNPINIASNRNLEDELRARGLPHERIAGSYNGVDQGPNYLVAADRDTLHELRDRYGQDSVLTNRGLEYTDGMINPALHEQSKFGPEAEKEPFFSRLSNGKPFSMGIDFDRRVADTEATTAESRAAKAIRNEWDSYKDLSPEQHATLRKVGAIVDPATFRERIAAKMANWQERTVTGLVDDFRPLMKIDPDRKISTAYMMAKLSRGYNGTMEALLRYGKIFLNSGAPDVDINDPTGGFAKVLSDLKGETQRALMWVAGQRGAQLKANGLENLMDAKDIANLKVLNAGKMQDGRDRGAVYDRFLKNLTDYNNAGLDMAEKSGLITKEVGQLFRDHPYVPFYRVQEDIGKGSIAPFSKAGLTDQKAWTRLKGGTNPLNSDLLENVLGNWAHIFQSSAKNRAALATVDTLLKSHTDVIEHIAPGRDVPKGSFQVLRDGVGERYLIHDPLLADAVSSFNYVQPDFIKALGRPKQFLTAGITLSPYFRVRIGIREAIASLIQSPIGVNPLRNVLDGWSNTDARNPIFASTMASGGQIRFGQSERSIGALKLANKLTNVHADDGVIGSIGRQLGSLWDAYHELGNKTENFNRTALYQQLRAKVNPETGQAYTHAEAAFAARDLLDFSAGGKWAAVKFLSATVPFMNARAQGLYSIGKTFANDPNGMASLKNKVTAVTMAACAASLGLMLSQQDEDWWKQRTQQDRDAYWAFKIGNHVFRMPKPFELGAAASMAERTWELAANKDMTLARYGSNFGQVLMNSLSFDPTPQVVKPLLSVYANRDPTTQAPIESAADQRELPAQRYDETTSQVARFLGGMGVPDPVALAQATYRPLSPKQIDYLIGGYTSSYGLMAAGALDYAHAAATGQTKAAATLKQETGSFVSEADKETTSRYVQEMHQHLQGIEEAYASYEQAAKRGDVATAQEVLRTHGAELRKYGVAVEASRLMTEFNGMIKRAEASGLSPDEKRALITQRQQQKNAIAKRFEDVAQQ